MQALYNGVYLSDPRLEPVWAELEHRKAVVFFHPNATTSAWDRPGALMEVAFQTAYVIVDMLYAGVFRRHPNIRFIIAHCGGALPPSPAGSLPNGAISWVPNPQNITRDEISEVLGRPLSGHRRDDAVDIGGSSGNDDSGQDRVYGIGLWRALRVDDQSIAENIEALLAFRGSRPTRFKRSGGMRSTCSPGAPRVLPQASHSGDAAAG